MHNDNLTDAMFVFTSTCIVNYSPMNGAWSGHWRGDSIRLSISSPVNWAAVKTDFVHLFLTFQACVSLNFGHVSIVLPRGSFVFGLTVPSWTLNFLIVERKVSRYCVSRDRVRHLVAFFLESSSNTRVPFIRWQSSVEGNGLRDGGL